MPIESSLKFELKPGPCTGPQKAAQRKTPQLLQTSGCIRGLSSGAGFDEKYCTASVSKQAGLSPSAIVKHSSCLRCILDSWTGISLACRMHVTCKFSHLSKCHGTARHFREVAEPGNEVLANTRSLPPKRAVVVSASASGWNLSLGGLARIVDVF